MRAHSRNGLIAAISPSGKLKRLIRATRFALAMLAGLFSAPALAIDNQYIVLCYHSVPERYNGDPMAVSAGNLAAQLSWLRAQGYTAISVSDVLKAKAGKIKLPAKSFMLTVDDGYHDFYTNAFPLLKMHKVPAVFAVVGKWIESGVPVGNEADPHFRKQRFVTWSQLREMADSGLVEVASHSYDLHHGILANPQGNTQPAAVTLRYNAATRRYETVAERRLRIRDDLAHNSALIEHHLGKRPRVMVWPYGAHDRIGIEEAARMGMPINLTLNAGAASASNSEIIPRALADKEMPLGAFSYMVQSLQAPPKPSALRALTVNLDTLYHANADVQNQNLGKLLDRVQDLGLNAVFLQPFARARDGVIEQAYFPNTVLPMRADLANRVAWQLRSRINVDVYAFMPTTNIAIAEKNKRRPLDAANERDRRKLLALYEDFASHTPVRGVIFADGAGVTDFDKKLLTRVRYYRPPVQPLYAGRVLAHERASGAPNAIDAAGGEYRLAIVPAPLDRSDAQLKEFIAAQPPGQVTILSLPVADLQTNSVQALARDVRAWQRHGLHHFVLDDARFLDDATAVAALRQVLSLKHNPYLHVGQ